MNILGPILDRRLIYETYACREGKGVHAALKKSQQAVRKYKYYLKCDIKKYFESIDHLVLKKLLGKIIKDKKLLHETKLMPIKSYHFASKKINEVGAMLGGWLPEMTGSPLILQ